MFPVGSPVEVKSKDVWFACTVAECFAEGCLKCASGVQMCVRRDMDGKTPHVPMDRVRAASASPAPTQQIPVAVERILSSLLQPSPPALSPMSAKMNEELQDAISCTIPRRSGPSNVRSVVRGLSTRERAYLFTKLSVAVSISFIDGQDPVSWQISRSTTVAAIAEMVEVAKQLDRSRHRYQLFCRELGEEPLKATDFAESLAPTLPTTCVSLFALEIAAVVRARTLYDNTSRSASVPGRRPPRRRTFTLSEGDMATLRLRPNQDSDETWWTAYIGVCRASYRHDAAPTGLGAWTLSDGGCLSGCNGTSAGKDARAFDEGDTLSIQLLQMPEDSQDRKALKMWRNGEEIAQIENIDGSEDLRLCVGGEAGEDSDEEGGMTWEVLDNDEFLDENNRPRNSEPPPRPRPSYKKSQTL